MTSRTFGLAGLLRLRTMEEDQAGARLSAANARSQVLRSRTGALRGQLADTPAAVNSAAALRYAAISRASMSSMLADLQTLEAVQDQETQAAREAFGVARARTAGLEKLEARHSREVIAADLAAEQIALDEIASGARHLRKESTLR